MKTTKGPIEEILDGLEEQSAILSKEELKAELAEEGIDVEGLIFRTKALVQKYRKSERMAWMNEADRRKTLLDSAASRVSSWLDRTDEEIRAAFGALSGSGGPAVAFRNQGDLTVQDMARILDKREELKDRLSSESGDVSQ